MWALLVGTVLATDRGPGTWQIGANPAGAGEGWVSAGGSWIGWPRAAQEPRDPEESAGVSGLMVLPAVELFYAWDDRFATQARFQSGPVFADDGPYLMSVPVVTTRWLVLDRERLRLAPTLGFGAFVPEREWAVGAALGLAVDWGGERLRVDLSWPIFGAAMNGSTFIPVPPWAGLLVTEVGLTAHLHEKVAVRVGTTGFFPMVTVRLRGDRAFVDLSGGAAPEFGPTAGLQAGVTFGP